MTFWHPNHIYEGPPREQFPLDSARRLEDLYGHCDAVLRWGGNVTDDDEWYVRNGRRCAVKRPWAAGPTINVMQQHMPFYAVGGTAVSAASSSCDGVIRFPAEAPYPPPGPKNYDKRDLTAVERRRQQSEVPAPPPVSQRLKQPAGLWQWQQREVKLENDLVKRYIPATQHVPFRHEYSDLADKRSPRETSASPRRTFSKQPQLPHLVEGRPATSDSESARRRREVKKKIMQLAEAFGV